MENLANEIIKLAIKIQQVPAPTFTEAARGVLMGELFSGEGLVDIEQDEIGNVFARLPGVGESPPLVITAHLDTVFPMDTELALRTEMEQIIGPGIGDNSLGLAGLIGVVRGLNKQGNQQPGDLWLVANVGEEGLGNLRGMHKVVDRFGANVQGYLVLEGMAFGQIYHRGLGVRRYRINMHTAGGHSWVDHGQPSAIHELASLVNRLTAISLPAQPRTTLNVGIIMGGTSVNTIAAQASLLLDLRSEDSQTLEALAAHVEALVLVACRGGVEAKFEVVGIRPAGEIPANHRLVRLAVESLQALGIQARLNIGSTDANVPLSRGIPAITLGLTTGGKAHTLNEYIHTDPIQLGIRQLLSLIPAIYLTQ